MPPISASRKSQLLGEQAAASKPAASAMANENFAFICVAYRREAGRTENIVADAWLVSLGIG